MDEFEKKHKEYIKKGWVLFSVSAIADLNGYWETEIKYCKYINSKKTDIPKTPIIRIIIRKMARSVIMGEDDFKPKRKEGLDILYGLDNS